MPVGNPEDLNMSLFEIGMLVCFAASWPFAIVKTWRTKSGRGKSFPFLGLLMLGYVLGIMNKLFVSYDHVMFLYAFNLMLVAMDTGLSWMYRRS